MSNSMTGYSRIQQEFPQMNVLLEIKSVNHRYFEFSIRLPRVYGFLEDKIKGYLQSRVRRGKIDCYLQIESLAEDDVVISTNHALAKGYLREFSALAEQYNIPNDVSVATLGRYNDIFTVRKQEADEDAIWDCVFPVLQDAVDQFIAMRKTEGDRLEEDIMMRLNHILDDVAYIETRSPETVQAHNEKLKERMRELLGDTTIDEQRLLTEAAIFADKIAVAEETVRLRSHIAQLTHFFQEENSAVGRKMDFLVQEMNREANTIGSKAQDVEIARRVVNVKAEIEKIREQIQNIE